MAIIVGICPNCNHVLGVAKRTLFIECDACHKTVGVRDACAYLEDTCADPANIQSVIDLSLELADDGEIEKSLAIVEKLHTFHPQNEDIAYTHVRMSGYEHEPVRQYLDTFAGVKGEKPYAEDFLDNIMDSRYITMLPQMIKFAENKLPATLKRKYLEILEGMRDEYTMGTRTDTDGMTLMYIMYTVGTVLNITMAILFYFMKIPSNALLWHLLIAIALCCIEFGFMFLHNRIYGNRLNISQTERYFMLTFMCSIPITIGGALIFAMI